MMSLAIDAMTRYPEQKRLLVAGALVFNALFSEKVRAEMEETTITKTCVGALAAYGTYPEMVSAMCALLTKLVSEATFPQFKEKKALEVLILMA